MTASTGYQATLGELTYAQLADALTASNNEYDRRYEAFRATVDAANAIIHAGEPGLPGLAEVRADMEGAIVEMKTQSAMTRAIAAEITVRRVRGDYA